MEVVIKKISRINNSRRWDYRFHQHKFSNLEEKLEECTYPLYSVAKITSQVVDGTHFTPEYTDDSGILFLMARNISPHEIDLTNVTYITVEEHQKLIRCKPEPGDVLVTKDGKIGVAAVVPDTLPEFNIFVSVIKLRPKQIISPHYLAAFINSNLGQLQIQQQIKGAAITHIHLEDMRRIKVPVPPRPVQDEIAQVMQDAYAIRRGKLEESQNTYTQISDYVLRRLEINLTVLLAKRFELVPISRLKGGRFDFEAVVTLPHITSNFGVNEVTLLNQVVSRINRRITPANDCPEEEINYISLANIESNTGNLINYHPVLGKKILSSSPKFQKGDILFGRMRPYLNKVWVAEFDGICSGEILVFRSKYETINIRFLYALLLNRITLDQIIPLQSGSSIPRVSVSDVLNVRLPIPKDSSKQQKIGNTVEDYLARAQRLRTEAEAVVAEAKVKVERMILDKTIADAN